MRKSILFLLGILIFCNLVMAKTEKKRVYSISELVDMAIKSNLSVKMAKDDINKSNSQVKQAWSALIPDISVSQTNIKMNNFMGFGVQYGNGWSLNIAQPLYTGGKIESAYKISLLGKKLSNDSFENEKQQITYNVITNAINILKLEKLVSVAEKSLKLIEEHKKIAIANLNVGIAVKNDVLRVEVREATVKSQLTTNRANFEKAKKSLAFLLNYSLNGDFSIKEFDNSSENISCDIDKLFKTAIKFRPDIKILNKQLEIAKRNIRIAYADRFPTVSAFASKSMGENISTSHQSWQIGLKADLTLIDGGYISGKINEKKAEYEKIKKKLALLEDNIKLQLKMATLDLESSSSNIDVAKIAVEQALENLRLTENRFKSGTVSSINVLDDEVALTEARTRYFTSLYDYKLAEAKLYLEQGRIEELTKLL